MTEVSLSLSTHTPAKVLESVVSLGSDNRKIMGKSWGGVRAWGIEKLEAVEGKSLLIGIDQKGLVPWEMAWKNHKAFLSKRGPGVPWPWV